MNIPFPESGHRWHDIVLNDGAPVGYRRYNGQEIPVLNELQLLESSTFGTFVAEVSMPEEPALLVTLAELAKQWDGFAEDWSTSVRFLCKACSEGRQHDAHYTEAKPVEGSHFIGIAATDRTHAKAILSEWQASNPAIAIQSLATKLKPDAAGRDV